MKKCIHLEKEKKSERERVATAHIFQLSIYCSENKFRNIFVTYLTMNNYEEPQVVRRNNNKKKADKRKMRDGKALSRIQFQQVACTIILH